ncbi:MAG: zeta toxin family protein [Candidatus Hydrogenedentes bacterium]|nr:zeta toxin family protein [Candidatus Hydrogenedentota bacterium]
MRLFAGPNGSGKSTLKGVLSHELLGAYLNPDEIESHIRETGSLSLAPFGVRTTAEEILAFFSSSSLLHDANMLSAARRLHFSGGQLHFDQVAVNSYFASVALDFLRTKLLEAGQSFTFETVMSHGSKIDILEKARKLGFRIYLYYIATEDPVINISRVEARVKLGGHPVPVEKIVSRYYRSLALLWDAIARTDRAYIFDNSGEGKNNTWLAEITGGDTMELKANEIPHWFQKAVLDKVP